MPAVILPLIVVCFGANAQVVVNEYSVSNLNTFPDNYNKYEDWIELYNTGNSTVNLQGYFLSDRVNKPTKWEIPAGVSIPAKGYRVFWTSGRSEVSGGHYHTGFKLSQTKATQEYVILTDPGQNIIDSIPLANTQLGHSRGRTVDGGASWSVFQTPTLNTTNNIGTGFPGYALSPTMNLPAGFHQGSQTVSLATNEPNAEIHYTTDGSIPTSSSPLYTGPVSISTTTILKAITISNNPQILPSLITFNTYFLNTSHNVPVVSVSSAELPLLLDGDKAYTPHGTFEYFDITSNRTTFGYGEFNSHGQDSWVHDQRSIDYISRDEMGYAHAIQHKLFPQSDRDKFQRVILRASGDDNYPGIDSSAHMRDMFVQTLAQEADMHLDTRKAARCVMYVNGQYWGLYNLREKVDDQDYTKYYYDQDKYNLEYLMLWGTTWVEFGDDPDTYYRWRDLYDFITTEDMSIDANYDSVKKQFNYKSLVDYILINSYVVCSDWLNYNVGWWRGLDPEGNHKKWGYVLWDEDATFGHYINYTGVPETTPYVDPCYPEQLDNMFSDPEGHINVLNSLRNNADFAQYYVSRYIDLLNTEFNCEHMLSLLDSLEDEIRPEMPLHISRWGGTMNKWTDNVDLLRDFITERCNIMPDGLKDCYTLTGPYDLAVSVEPAGAGEVKLNSLKLKQYPWSGEYYGGMDVILKATPEDSTYVFDHWEVSTHNPSPDDTTREVRLQLNASDSVVAVFKYIGPPAGLNGPELSADVIAIQPNPFLQSTTLTFESLHDYGEVYFQLHDVLGKKVRHQLISATSTSIQREGLPAGVYFYSLTDRQDMFLSSGRLVIE